VSLSTFRFLTIVNLIVQIVLARSDVRAGNSLTVPRGVTWLHCFISDVLLYMLSSIHFTEIKWWWWSTDHCLHYRLVAVSQYNRGYPLLYCGGMLDTVQTPIVHAMSDDGSY